MKVLFIVEHYYPHVGGGEKLFLDLADALNRNGVEVRVVTSDSGGTVGKHTHDNVDIYSYSWKSLFGHPMPTLRDLDEHVKWADIVQTAQYTAAPAAVRVARKYDKPCVMMAYEYLGSKWYMVDGRLRATLFRLFEAWVFRQQYTHYIAISEASKQDLMASSIGRNGTTTIYPVFNSFDAWNPVKQKLDGKSKTFLYYGRPGKTKGIATLLESIYSIHDELDTNITFEFIASNDPIQEKNALKAFVADHRLSRRIKVSDSLPQQALIDRIAEAYCVIVPSLTEGFGYSAYQAARMKKNLIVSDAGSLPEVISGRCLVFKKGDTVSLADAIRKAVKGDFVNYSDRVGGDNVHKVIELYEELIG